MNNSTIVHIVGDPEDYHRVADTCKDKGEVVGPGEYSALLADVIELR